jgi:hypothetical protein
MMKLSTAFLGVCATFGSVLTSGCLRELPRFGSISPDRRCDITVSYLFISRLSLQPRLSVFIRCGTEQREVFVGHEAWRPLNAEFYWSQDSRLVTFIACNELGPPTLLTYDTVSSRTVSSNSQLDAFRQEIRNKLGGRNPCDSECDPILWACCVQH